MYDFKEDELKDRIEELEEEVEELREQVRTNSRFAGVPYKLSKKDVREVQR